MNATVIVLLALFGLAIGSFLNVFILRYKPDQDRFLSFSRTRGRSQCPHCQTPLQWYELVPLISFVLLRGRCRTCKGPIAWQYPIVETASAVLFAGVPLLLRDMFVYWDPSWQWLFVAMCGVWIVALLALLIAFVIDMLHTIIPNSLNGLLLVMGAIWTGIGWWTGITDTAFGGSFVRQYWGLAGAFDAVWLNHIVGMVVATTFFFLIVWLSKGTAMGMGDVKLIGALGLLFGWPDILFIMFLSFVIGAAYALMLMAQKKKTMKDRVPFGPFIVIAAYAIFFFGAGLLDVYFGILGV